MDSIYPFCTCTRARDRVRGAACTLLCCPRCATASARNARTYLYACICASHSHARRVEWRSHMPTAYKKPAHTPSLGIQSLTESAYMQGRHECGHRMQGSAVNVGAPVLGPGHHGQTVPSSLVIICFGWRSGGLDANECPQPTASCIRGPRPTEHTFE